MINYGHDIAFKIQVPYEITKTKRIGKRMESIHFNFLLAMSCCSHWTWKPLTFKIKLLASYMIFHNKNPVSTSRFIWISDHSPDDYI